MYQFGAFQAYAYQTATNDNEVTGGGYTYEHESLRRAEEKYKKKLKKEKSELEKVNSVISLYEKQKVEAAKQKVLANKKLAAEAKRKELELLNEINRLLQVRAMLLRNIRQNEEALIIILISLRRRLRAA